MRFDIYLYHDKREISKQNKCRINRWTKKDTRTKEITQNNNVASVTSTKNCYYRANKGRQRCVFFPAFTDHAICMNSILTKC